jgi:hypothetical protein
MVVVSVVPFVKYLLHKPIYSVLMMRLLSNHSVDDMITKGYCNLMTSPKGQCDKNVASYDTEIECVALFCSNFPTNSFPIGLPPSFISRGNSRECRLYHAQVGVQTNNDTECLYATQLSVIGTCVTSDLAYISDGNAATATYCHNHIRTCGTISTDPTYGMTRPYLIVVA